MMTQSRRESRRAIRLPVLFQVDDGGGECQCVTTRDVSVMGAYLEQADVEPGKTVHLTISIGESEVEVIGEVIRREEGGLAVQFNWASDNARDLLSALVASVFDPNLVAFE